MGLWGYVCVLGMAASSADPIGACSSALGTLQFASCWAYDQRTTGGLGQMGNQLGSPPPKDLKPNQARTLGCAMASHSDWRAV